MKFGKIENVKISETVAYKILSMIEEGFYKPGDKIPTEEEFVSIFGVSRTSIREGLQRLKSINIIEVYPGRGTFVSKTKKSETNLENTFDSSKHVFDKDKKINIEFVEFRRSIELCSIDLIFRNIRESDFKNMEKCIEDHEKNLKNKIKYFPKGDLSFHKKLIHASHNSFMIEFYDNYVFPILLIFAEGSSFRLKTYTESLAFNKLILKGFYNKDKAFVIKILNDHFDWIVDGISKKKNKKHSE